MPGTKTGSVPIVVGDAATITNDKQASAQLRILHGSYLKYKKARPKSPSEAAVLPTLFMEDGPARLAAIDLQYVADTVVWREKMKSLLLSFSGIGQSHPNACIAIEGTKTGRIVQKNGAGLFSALMREEADVLNGEAL